MVAVQLGTIPTDALAYLRAFAYSRDHELNCVATQVLRSQLAFDHEPCDDESR
jgi:hypothetical protein